MNTDQWQSTIHPPCSINEAEILMRNRHINTSLKPIIMHVHTGRQIKIVEAVPCILICNIPLLFNDFLF